MAGVLALAAGSSGCATVLAQHKIATHGSTMQGVGTSEGGTGSLGKLDSILNGKGSKANAAGTTAGVGNGVTPPESPSSLFTGVVQFAAAHGGLPVFIAEWGSVAYSNPSVRVNWINQMQSFVAANPSIHAAMYWDSEVPPCNSIIDNSPSSLSAMASVAQSALMQGRPAA